MSQTAITLAFEQWKASQAVTGEAVLLDEFVFASVPGLDVSKPIDRNEALPPAAQIVHRQVVSRKGVVSENAVVHSVVLGAEVGDFSFNWVGLMNKASNTLAMIVHAPVQQKLKTKDGQQGNVLTRSFLMEFDGAQAETAINTPAETWQIDFTARMAGMDERQRLENIDLYGAAAFLGEGYLVAKNGSQFFVTAGAGYVRGLRAQLAANQIITVTTKPVKVWLDVAWTGTLTSAWGVTSKVTLAANLADYAQNGVQHYVFAVASIDANGNITDLRPKGTLNDQTASDALKKHEQSRNHPDATTAAKGFTQLSSATDSVSESVAATPKAVKAAYDLASAKYTAQDATTGQKGIVQLSSATDSMSEVLAATPKAVKTVSDELTSVKKSLGTAATKDIVTSARDTTAGRVLTVGYAGIGGYGSTNMLTADQAKVPLPNGFYGVQTDATYGNAALISFGYDSGSQVHIIAKQGGQAPLIGLAGSNPKGEFGAWGKIYTEFQKPTADDVGALPIAGGTMTGLITTSSDGKGSFASQLGSKAPVYQEINTAATSEYWPIVKQKYIQGNSAWSMGVLVNAGRLQIYFSAPDNANDKNFSFQTDGQLILPNYANFDARYYGKAESDGRYYTKAQSDAGYMPKTGAYTKAESDGRYPLKTATVIDVRQGSPGTIVLTRNGWNYVPGGCAFTGWYVEGDAPVGDTIQYKPIQININGAWRTISG